jgi:hypothetical protein
MNSQTPTKDPFDALDEDFAASIDKDLKAFREEVAPAKPAMPAADPLRLREPFRPTLPERKPAPLASTPPEARVAPQPATAAPQAPTAAQPAPDAPADSGGAVVATTTASTEVENFLANGSRLYDKQRKKILALETAAEFDRVKLIDDYRVKLRDLEHEANEALRSFDIKHDSELASAKRILEALGAMRG